VSSVPATGAPTKAAPGVQTLERAVTLIETVAAAGGCSLADLVRRTGLARPTAYRLAIACEQQGLLIRDGDGRFRLGGRLVGWGAQAARTNPLVSSARPVLARLVDDTGESAQLYVREGDRRVCIATDERSSGLRDTVPLGAVMPLHRGSGGKVLLAWADDRDRFDVPAGVLQAVRARGYAESTGEREPGVASVSAPVRTAAGEVVAAISVSGPAERMGADAMARHRDAVLAAAATLRVQVGPGGVTSG
jgi:DNA-binding IclR family transcriptional regulator